MPGICQIDIAPQSIEATFTGRQQEPFQFTKVMMIIVFFFYETHRYSVFFKKYSQGLFYVNIPMKMTLR